MLELNGAPVTTADLAALALVNYGHFTSMRVDQDGAVRGLQLHLDRLTRDCRIVFAADLDPDRVRAYVRHALEDVDSAAVVRVTIYDPALEMSRPGAPAEPHVLVSLRPAPATSHAAALRLQSVVFSRDLPKVKHIGLFGAEFQRAIAQRAGFDDVVFTAGDGSISEIATSNIAFITTEGRLVWPHSEVLAGTTMQLLNQVRDEEVVKRVTLAQLGTYAGAVATNAATGVRAVASIDDTQWPEHEVVAILRKQYESIPPQKI